MIRRQLTGAMAACALLAAAAAGFTSGRTARIAATAPGASTRVAAAAGYTVRLAAEQFTAPVGVAAGPGGELFIAESGAGTGTPPRVVRLGPGSKRTVVAADFPAPLTGLTWHDGLLLVSYRGGVAKLDPATGVHTSVLSKLPAAGDHANNPVAVGPDRKLYFGIGTATNAGVVGPDNIERGWVQQAPDFHDIPCKPVKLRGINLTVPNPLTKDPHDQATTGAYSAFGKTTARNQEFPGALPCTGAVLRANMDGTGLELIAWGLRNPYGVAFGPDGRLYATMQGFEDRGSRPIVGDPDYFYRIDEDRWYGWPDYAGGRSVTTEVFQKPGLPAKNLLAEVPEQPPLPIAMFDHGSMASGMLFPPERFGLRGDALVALSARHMVVRVNPRSGDVTPFALNHEPDESTPGLALQHPIGFSPGPGGSVYLIDYGQLRPGPGGPEPVPGTGTLWLIKRQ